MATLEQQLRCDVIFLKNNFKIFFAIFIIFFTLSFKAESRRDWNSFHDDER